MRRIGILIILVTVLSSCKSEHPKDYLTFSGTIENSKDSVMTILGEGFKNLSKLQKMVVLMTPYMYQRPSFTTYFLQIMAKELFFKEWFSPKVNQ